MNQRSVEGGLATWMSRLRSAAPAALLAFALVVLWQLAIWQLDVPKYILPSPLDILNELVDRWAGLSADLGWTMLEAFLGFLAGSGLAFLAAVVFIHVPVVERAAFPWAIVLQTVPIIALAPLLTIWFGFSLTPKIIIAAIICFFPVLVNATRGLRAVSPQAMELMQILSASKAAVFRRLRLPTSIPYLFAGLRVAATLSVVGSIVAEFTGADRGIGHVIVSAAYRIDTPLMFAAITLSSVGGILFFNLIGGLERMLLRWPDARIE